MARRSLAARLILFLTLALLPLGLIAVYQTIGVIREASELAKRDILARTAEAAETQYTLLQRAWGSASALGAAVQALGDEASACAATMKKFVEANPAFTFAGFTAVDGSTRCASGGEGANVMDAGRLREFLNDPRQMVSINAEGREFGESVILATVPVFAADDELLGGTTISIPHSLTDTLLQSNIENIAIALLDRDGTVLAASMGVEDAAGIEAYGIRPADVPMSRKGATLPVVTGDGEEALVALVPLLPARLYVLGQWTKAAQPYAVSLLGTATPAFPVLMWIASLFVAFFAIEWLVLRHLKVLRARMSSFSLEDHESSYVRLPGAPAEIAEIAASYNAMIDRIGAGTEALEQNVREKEVLLKEVHHRVKNNLQLIASILNMQLRTIRLKESRSALRQVQRRVMSLATIYKAIYSDTDVGNIWADQLLSELVDGLLSNSSADYAKVTPLLDLVPVALTPDQAVPLSLLASEALTNAASFARASQGAQPAISVVLQESGGNEVRFVVSCLAEAPARRTEARDQHDAIGTKLIEAFAKQLRGTMHVETTDHSFVLRLEFPREGTG